MQNGSGSLVELHEDELDLVAGGISLTFPPGMQIGVAGPGGSVTVTAGKVVAQSGPDSFSFGFLIGSTPLTLDYPL